MGRRPPADGRGTRSAGRVPEGGRGAETEIALVVAERTGTDVATDVYPRLVAGVVGAALNAATQQWLLADRSQSMEEALRDVFGRLATGLAEPR